MTMYQVNILNPKATKLLQDLADLELITLAEIPADPFQAAIDGLRQRAAAAPPILTDISKEIETVRAKRYARRKA
ncbi:hypothetical protein [Hymenobacter baengnokdamensis]|uniref:hypothetical protein n=1 Tax=Hymenobacter baengnokdamensis TaxID=2615203 RepID=UPI0012469996|nr:hypothetical protein [Hymenobacter baengnokdamensis]